MPEASGPDSAALAYDDAAEARHLGLREQFLLRPDIVFLNHGSYGACPRPVFEIYQKWQFEAEAQPVEFLGRRSHGLLDESRAALAGYLHCDRDEIVYSQNVTTALNVVARSLPLAEGYEQYRIEIPVVEWRDQRFVRISVQGYNTRADAQTLVDALAEILRDER